MARRSTTRIAVVAAVGIVVVCTAAVLPFLSPLKLNPTVTLAYQGFRLGAWLIWLVAILVTMVRQPDNPLWRLMFGHMVAAQIWVLSYLGESVSWSLSLMFKDVVLATGVHVFLAFPSGHLRDRWDRIVVGLFYAVVIGSSVLGMLVWETHRPCEPVCITNVFVVWPNADLYQIIRQAAVVVLVPAIPVLVLLLGRHWRDASPIRRRVLLPLLIALPILAATFAAEFVADRFGFEFGRAIFESPFEAIRILVLPVAMLLGVLQLRMDRGRIADLVIELGRGSPLGGLRNVLARTLGDPSLELAFAAPSGGGFVDAAGLPYALPVEGRSRAVARLEIDGDLLGVLIHDPAIDAENPGLVAAVASVARMALENERLAAQVRAQLEEVRASRARIVEAADAERRRVERDLHDGAQQRLVALAMRLGLARETTSGGASLLDEVTAELRTAITEVRDLARGLHPTILTDAGLGAAVEALAERTPMPLVTDIPDRRYPTTIEATAYFVVAEALTNIARHAEATEAAVTIREDGEWLIVTVVDDGRGGADPAKGSGLRGLADRVAASGGRLAVSSSPGGGSRVEAELPLGTNNDAAR